MTSDDIVLCIAGGDMAGIRWGRGFFRVWIVLAIVWIGLGTAISLGTAVDPYISPRLAAVPSDTGKVTLYPTYGTVADDVRRLVSEGAMKSTEIAEGFSFYTTTASSAEGVARATVEAKAAVEDYVASETTKARVSAVAWTLLPPLAVLIVGWAIGWAISGFRRNA